MQFPISIKINNILKSKNRVDRIITFENEEYYQKWKEQTKAWEEITKQKTDYKILDTVETDTLIIHKEV